MSLKDTEGSRYLDIQRFVLTFTTLFARFGNLLYPAFVIATAAAVGDARGVGVRSEGGGVAKGIAGGGEREKGRR